MSEQIQASGFMVRKNRGLRRFPSGGVSYTPGARHFFTNYSDAMEHMAADFLNPGEVFEVEAVNVSVTVEV